MSGHRSVEELEKLLQEAELRAQESEKQRAAERQRADREQQRAEREQQRAEKEQQRAEASEEQTRATTLDEYIAACHSLVFSKLSVERDRSITSKGSITNPKNKLCPTSLRPWSSFIDQQRKVYGLLYDAFPREAQLFESRSFLSGLGDRISLRAIANEKGLEYFLHNSVEDPVKSILHQLKDVEHIRTAYDIGDGIVFENHPSAISDVAEEVMERENSSLPRTPDHGRLSNQLRPDQICIYRSDDNISARRSMAYVCEYKAPHKLTAPHLRVGLRPMNVYKDVVNRKTIPTSADSDGRFQYHAERLTAAAISQTYHYMIEGGLEHGLLTTGETIVFLKVDWSDPGTLYYHLAEPGPEVSIHREHFRSCTAVGQYLAFTLMALGQPGQQRKHGQEERRVAILGLKTWAEDFESTLRSIPASDRTAPGDSPYYEPTTYADFDRSPYQFRFQRRPINRGDEPAQPARRDSPGSSDDEVERRLPDTPSPAERRTGGRTRGPRRSQRTRAPEPGGSVSRSDVTPAQYCTQRCLLGLVKSTKLDRSCPNISLHVNDTGHSTARSSNYHRVSHSRWLQLVRDQLKASLDIGVVPLGESGSRGALFRVTLIAYGYTFVCKGTVQAFIKDLEYEATVYNRLEAIQGTCIPVFLGSIDLRLINKIYYYDHRVYIVHMSFMSWAGHKLDQCHLIGGLEARLANKALHSLRAIHREGVVHNDVHVANMLFDPRTNRVMIIDFERSFFVQSPRVALKRLVPNKRTWTPEITDKGKATNSYQKGDMIMANAAFCKLNWFTVR